MDRQLSRRKSAADAEEKEQEQEQLQASPSNLKPGALLTLERFLQDLPNAEQPPVEHQTQYHTGRLPNSRAGEGKPRLLLMGQKR